MVTGNVITITRVGIMDTMILPMPSRIVKLSSAAAWEEEL